MYLLSLCLSAKNLLCCIKGRLWKQAAVVWPYMPWPVPFMDLGGFRAGIYPPKGNRTPLKIRHKCRVFSLLWKTFLARHCFFYYISPLSLATRTKSMYGQCVVTQLGAAGKRHLKLHAIGGWIKFTESFALLHPLRKQTRTKTDARQWHYLTWVFRSVG